MKEVEKGAEKVVTEFLIVFPFYGLCVVFECVYTNATY